LKVIFGGFFLGEEKPEKCWEKMLKKWLELYDNKTSAQDIIRLKLQNRQSAANRRNWTKP
jgi:hypothetical protein